MAEPILQPGLPKGQAEMAAAALPRMQTIPLTDWLHQDSAYAAQLAEKRRLIAERPAAVMALLPRAEAAAEELAEMVAEAALKLPGFAGDAGTITCPDGRVVDLTLPPLLRIAGLVQEDMCLLQIEDGEAVLTGALLCFPAAWTLAEKLGRPMTAIHTPVPRYDAQIAARVQRMMDHLAEGRVLLRANLLRYDLPDLYQPHSEAAPRPVGRPDSPYIRSERQTLRRLPRTGAIAFGIHTTVVRGPQAGVQSAIV